MKLHGVTHGGHRYTESYSDKNLYIISLYFYGTCIRVPLTWAARSAYPALQIVDICLLFSISESKKGPQNSLEQVN